MASEMKVTGEKSGRAGITLVNTIAGFLIGNFQLSFWLVGTLRDCEVAVIGDGRRIVAFHR